MKRVYLTISMVVFSSFFILSCSENKILYSSSNELQINKIVTDIRNIKINDSTLNQTTPAKERGYKSIETNISNSGYNVKTGKEKKYDYIKTLKGRLSLERYNSTYIPILNKVMEEPKTSAEWSNITIGYYISKEPFLFNWSVKTSKNIKIEILPSYYEYLNYQYGIDYLVYIDCQNITYSKIYKQYEGSCEGYYDAGLLLDNYNSDIVLLDYTIDIFSIEKN